MKEVSVPRAICLVATLSALFFGACSLDPKTGCRTADDCVTGRVCVAGTCQRAAHDAGQDGTFDEQPATDGANDRTEVLSPDLADTPGDAVDLAPRTDAPSDAPAVIDAPENLAGLDARSESLSPDLADERNVPPELDSAVGDAPPEVVIPDAALDAPFIVVDATLEAPFVVVVDAALETSVPTLDLLDDGPEPDAGFDKQSSGDRAADLGETLRPDLPSDPEGSPDSPVLPIDTPSDVPVALDADMPPALDSSQSGVDTGSAGDDGNNGGVTTWEPMGGTPISGPGVTHWGPGQNLDVFWRGTDDRLKHKWFPDNQAWSIEEDLGGTLASDPAATSRTTNMRDVFWRGTDNHLKHRRYPYGDGWSGEEDLGGTLASSPAAASWGTVALHVFWRGPDGNLKKMSLDYATNIWTGEIDLGIPVQSDPAARYRNNGVMDVFWRGATGTCNISGHSTPRTGPTCRIWAAI